MQMQQFVSNFIGRKREIDIFLQWLANANQTWILYFYDALEEQEKKGGVGKTWLLRKCAELARSTNANTVTVMIDFFNVADRDGIAIAEQVVKKIKAVYPEVLFTDFTASLQRYHNSTHSRSILIEQEIFDAFVSDLHDLEQRLLTTNSYLLIFFDTFELIEQNPIVAALSPSRTFPDNYLIHRFRAVIAGRNSLNWSHPNWQNRQQDMLNVALPPFSQEEMLQYLSTESIYSQQPESELIAALYERTEGRPILLSLATDVLNRRIITLRQLVTIPKVAFESYLVAQINNLEHPLNWTLLFMAHVFHRFNPTILEWLLRELNLQDVVYSDDRSALLATLSTLSFVRYPGFGNDFVLHDEMRRLVVKHCWEIQDPDKSKRREVSQCVIKYYEQESSSLQSELERQPYTIEILYHRLFVDVTDGLEYFQEYFSHAVSLLMKSYANSLLQEAQKFWDIMSEEQRNNSLLAEVRLLIAEEQATRALELCQKLEQESNTQWLTNYKVELLLEKGNSYLALSRLTEAISCLSDCLAIERERGNEQQSVTIMSGLGYIHRRLGQFNQAIDYYEKCISLYKKLGNKREYANLLNSIGNVYRYQGKTTKALNMCHVALSIRRELFQAGEINERPIALSLGTLGLVYLYAGNILQAGQYFQKALDIYYRIGYKSGISTTYNRLGQVEIEKQNFPQAKKYFEMAEVAALNINEEAYINSLNKQGRVLVQEKKLTEGIVFYQKAIEHAKKSLDRYQEAESLIDLCEALDSLGLHKESQKAWYEAQRVAEKENYHFLLGRGEEIQGDIYYKSKNYIASFEHYREFCYHMAEYNSIEYEVALRKIMDLLLNMPHDKIPLIVEDLVTYWSSQQRDDQYPEFIKHCKEVSELMNL